MIKAVLVMNTQGKPRLAKFYEFRSCAVELKMLVVSWMLSPSLDARLVYKHYATLYFVFIFDSSENELAMLDLIQVFVETLDKCFRNVCELDVVFNYSKMHSILDEIIFGGQVLETSSTEVLKAIEELSRLEAASNAMNLVPKSVSGWRTR
ncbi:AP-3 complex subunit sigma isoform X2 [Prosopis cineraria]|uniref:AP-3 complex subunit sigma isoform X2 n=1 Tax=Prosopis cineraria TaxID=364024 RepID=UPI00240F44D2|nr:AP-3 complex subunit sigma isoform X2 [Prosopis cineraria]